MVLPVRNQLNQLTAQEAIRKTLAGIEARAKIAAAVTKCQLCVYVCICDDTKAAIKAIIAHWITSEMPLEAQR